MREAIGGSWLFGIVVLFIALFASFLAYSISYTRAFNTKNQIINLIEKSEGYTRETSGVDIRNASKDQLSAMESVEAKAYLNIQSVGYNYTTAERIDCTTAGHVKGTPQIGGYCITKYCSPSESGGAKANDSKVYYKVTTFVAVDIPVLNIVVKIPISGETKLLYFDGSNTECDA